MRRTSALRANGTSLEPVDRWHKPMPLPGPVNVGIRRSLGAGGPAWQPRYSLV